MLTIIQISSKNRFQFTLSVLISVCLWSGVWVAPSAEAGSRPPQVQNLQLHKDSSSELKVTWDKQENVDFYVLTIDPDNYSKKTHDSIRGNSFSIDFRNWFGPEEAGGMQFIAHPKVTVNSCNWLLFSWIGLKLCNNPEKKTLEKFFYRKSEFTLTSENGAERWPGSSYIVRWLFLAYNPLKHNAMVELRIIDPDGLAYEHINLDAEEKKYKFQIDKNLLPIDRDPALEKWKVEGRLIIKAGFIDPKGDGKYYLLPDRKGDWETVNFFVRESGLNNTRANDTYKWIDEDIKCVRDDYTKLVWEATDRAQTFRWGGKTARDKDKQRGYRDWDSVIEEANQIELCGYNDWRVPTASELYGLIKIGDYEKDYESIDDKHRFINQYIFKNTGITYWTVTPSANGDDKAWVFNFKTGRSFLEPLDQFHSVRLVCDLPCQSSKDKD